MENSLTIGAPYSVLILTYNERGSIESTIASIPEDVSVTVLDSGSTDGTIEIASEQGAEIIEHPFGGFGTQRNYGIEADPCPLDWQLHLDADERMTPALDAAIRKELGDEPRPDAFALPNRTMLNGRWLRWSSSYPVYQTRLVNRRRARFINQGHGQQEADGTVVAVLHEPYIHDAFIKGIDAWIEKHNRYSRAEVDAENAGAIELKLRDLISLDRRNRRRALRELSRQLPFAPLLRSIHTLILRGGILDGRAGIQYSQMLALYEQMKRIKRLDGRLGSTRTTSRTDLVT